MRPSETSHGDSVPFVTAKQKPGVCPGLRIMQSFRLCADPSVRRTFSLDVVARQPLSVTNGNVLKGAVF